MKISLRKSWPGTAINRSQQKPKFSIKKKQNKKNLLELIIFFSKQRKLFIFFGHPQNQKKIVQIIRAVRVIN
jgi:hypothetical protein